MDQDAEDDISEYKRIRLLDHGQARWDLLACARHLLTLDYGGNELYHATAYHGPPVSEDILIRLLSDLPTRSQLRFKQRMRFKAYFEIKAIGGDPCIGFCVGLNPDKSHPGWEGSYTYDCSDGRLFASSIVGIPRDDFDGASGLTSSDIVGFGRSSRHGYVFINDKLIRELEALRRTTPSRLAELYLDTFTIKERHRNLRMHPIIGLREENVQVLAFFDWSLFNKLRHVREQMVPKCHRLLKGNLTRLNG